MSNNANDTTNSTTDSSTILSSDQKSNQKINLIEEIDTENDSSYNDFKKQIENQTIQNEFSKGYNYSNVDSLIKNNPINQNSKKPKKKIMIEETQSILWKIGN